MALVVVTDSSSVSPALTAVGVVTATLVPEVTVLCAEAVNAIGLAAAVVVTVPWTGALATPGCR